MYPGTLFIGDNGAFLCIPMKIGVKFEHWPAVAEVRAALCSVECRGAGAALQLRAAAQGEQQLAKVFLCLSGLLCLIILWRVVWCIKSE